MAVGQQLDRVAAIRRRAGEQAAHTIPEAELTPAVRAALSALHAELAALKAERSSLVDRLRAVEDLADRDPLTAVLNRRAFERELDRVIGFSARFGVQASLLYFDLDGFKQINDRHGHAAGDLVIDAVARLLAANVRDSDIVGRVGGDEFAVLLTKANEADAARKGQELASAVQRLVVPYERARLRVGISVGVTALQSGDTANEALGRADGSMYADKSRLRVQSL
jgi:diguanylate cyclase (GGDEF)-like protein